jgi:hypothetical protein
VVTAMAAIVSVVSTGLAPNAPVGESGLPLALSWAAVPCLVVLVAACWLLVADQPRSAVGLSLVAGAWLLPGLAAWPLPSAQVRAALLAAAPFAVAGIALVTAGWRPLPTEPANIPAGCRRPGNGCRRDTPARIRPVLRPRLHADL